MGVALLEMSGCGTNGDMDQTRRGKKGGGVGWPDAAVLLVERTECEGGTAGLGDPTVPRWCGGGNPVLLFLFVPVLGRLRAIQLDRQPAEEFTRVPVHLVISVQHELRDRRVAGDSR